ncbi:MAG TPA: beta-propeller fold lactonase family protein [Polyangiaceae bacterium]|jgi:YVTN family beta-propeller protein
MLRSRPLLLALLPFALLTGCRHRHGAARPPGPRAFVSNEASGDVSIVDLATRRVVATTPVGKRPRGVQKSPDGKFIYVALSGSVPAGPNVKGPVPPPDRSADAIGVLDARTGALVGKLPSGPDPEQFSLSKDGTKLYVSNEDAAQLSRVDVATKTIDKSLSVGEEPEGVTTSPDGRWIYVTCESSNRIEVVDAGSFTVVKELTVPARPRSVGFLPDTSKAYVTSELGHAVTVIALPAHDIVKTLDLAGEITRPMGIAVAPDGAHVFVTTGHAGTVLTIDTKTDELGRTMTAGRRPWGIAASADGKTLYAANGFSDDVSILDVASGAETGKVKVGSKPWGVVIVP